MLGLHPGSPSPRPDGTLTARDRPRPNCPSSDPGAAARGRPCHARHAEALVQLNVGCGCEHTLRSSLCGSVGVPPSPAFLVLLFPSISRSFSAVNPLGMRLLSPPRRIHYPSALPTPQARETRNKGVIVRELPPEFRCAGAQFLCSRLFPQSKGKRGGGGH